MKIDAHQHFWAINDTDYVWMSEVHDVIRRDFLPRDLGPLLATAGIDGCIAVQARQMVKETEWLLHLSEIHPEIVGVVGWVPLTDEAEPFLERFAAHPRLVGVRHVVHDEPDDDFILRREFGEGVRLLLPYGLVYDILIFERHLRQTIAFVDQHPNQPFVVDHIAKPRIQAGAFDSEWAANIRELAKRPNVTCKLSGMVTEVRDVAWSVEVLRPYAETVLDAFGPDRVMFGSDWPVCLLRAEYKAWVTAVRSMTASLSDSERATVWGGTAQRVYRLLQT